MYSARKRFIKYFLFQGTNNQFHRFIVVQEHLLVKYNYYMNTCNHFGLQVVIITVL